jgi:8-amino-7-oxononanoate synthase
MNNVLKNTPLSIFDKYAPLQSRVDLMMKIGKDALGLKFDDIISATRGKIDGREILLAGTNNYLGLTFDNDCMTAAKNAVDKHGTGTTVWLMEVMMSTFSLKKYWRIIWEWKVV